LTIENRGAGLIEALAATAVVGVGIVGLLAIAPMASHGMQDGSRLSTATFLAEQRLEQVRNAAWASAPDHDCLGLGVASAPTVPTGKICRLGTTTIAAGQTTFPDEAAVAGAPSFGRTVRIQDCGLQACAGIADPDLRLVTVTVTYASPTGTTIPTRNTAMTLAMIVARR
jgi:hypothetical protein